MKKLLSLALILIMTVGVAYAGNVWIHEDNSDLFDITWRASKDVTPDEEYTWIDFDYIYPLEYLANLEYFEAVGDYEVGNDKGKDGKKMKHSFLHLTIVGYLDGEMDFVEYSNIEVPMYKVVFGVKFQWDDGWELFHSALDIYMYDTDPESSTYMTYVPYEYDHGYDEALDDLDDGMTPNGFGSIWKLQNGLHD